MQFSSCFHLSDELEVEQYFFFLLESYQILYEGKYKFRGIYLVVPISGQYALLPLLGKPLLELDQNVLF